MSLLMDALKRAEHSKQEAARSMSGKEPRSGGLDLEPMAGRPSGNPLPDLAEHIEAVDAELATSAALPTTPKAKSGETRPPPEERQAVRSAFAARQPAPPPSRRPLWLALGLLSASGLAIGGYVAYRVLNIGHNALQLSASAQSAGASPRQPPPPATTIDAAVPPPAAEAAPAAAAPPAHLQPAPSPPPRPATRAARPVAPPPLREEGPIRLSRTPAAPDADQLRGYAHLQRNELDFARRDYEQALHRDPNNTDALLALGAIALRQGRAAEAERLHQRALIANPSEPAVQAAALGGAAAGTDPQSTESRLKGLLAAQPESAALNFAFGNLLARQQRWGEAQQAYFNAVAADGDNPDYLFNLAVSLDHLRQNRLAAQHYRLALEAAAGRPAAFDGAAARRRLAELLP